MLIELKVRRFRCRERACRQATFAEQVDELTFRHGRQSTGLQTVLERLAVMLAGRAGARLSQTLTAGVSRSTLLRPGHTQSELSTELGAVHSQP